MTSLRTLVESTIGLMTSCVYLRRQKKNTRNESLRSFQNCSKNGSRTLTVVRENHAKNIVKMQKEDSIAFNTETQVRIHRQVQPMQNFQGENKSNEI